MQPRMGVLSGSPQMGGGLLNQQTLAASRMALVRQQQAQQQMQQQQQQLHQQQQALAMMQAGGQLPSTLPRPQGFPGPTPAFPGTLGPGFPGQHSRFGPPRPQVRRILHCSPEALQTLLSVCALVLVKLNAAAWLGIHRCMLCFQAPPL